MKILKRIIAVAVIILIALTISYLIYTGGTGKCVEQSISYSH